MGFFSKPKTEDDLAGDIKGAALEIACALAREGCDQRGEEFQQKLTDFLNALKAAEDRVLKTPVDSVSVEFRRVLSSVGSVTEPLYLSDQFLKAAAMTLTRDLQLLRPNPFSRFSIKKDGPEVA